ASAASLVVASPRMKTTLLLDNDEVRATFAKWSKSATEIRIATAWATSACPVLGDLEASRSRLRALVVGLDFHQTDPRFLARFLRGSGTDKTGVPAKVM